MHSEYKRTVDRTLKEYLDEGLVPDELESEVETLLEENNSQEALILLREHRR